MVYNITYYYIIIYNNTYLKRTKFLNISIYSIITIPD